MLVDLTVRKRMLFDNLIMAAVRFCNTGLLLSAFSHISTILYQTYLQTYRTYDNNFKTKINPQDIYTSSPYRAVNTLLLCYKNQSVNAV